MNHKISIKDLAQRWVDASPRRDLRMLSRLSKVPYSSIRRMIQGEVATSLENVAAIAEVVATPEEMVSILAQHSPSLGNLYSPILKGETAAGNNIRDLFEDRYEVLAYCFSTKENGTTKLELSRFMGSVKLDSVLQSLHESGAVVIQGDTIKADTRLSVTFNDRTSYKMIDHFKSFGHMKDDRHPNTVFSVFEGFNQESIEELSTDIRNLEAKIAKFCQDQNRKGDYNWTFGMFSNTLISEIEND
ncbi:MAG: hypothetical protein HRU19_05145 [Pseudobacteriovorax sp.]|nr:hypothetical protein [Pseudobacteriovorax sp.]